MKKIKDYKNAALAALNGKWAPAVICSVVYVILTMAVSMSSAFADENSPTGIFIVSLLLQFVLSFIVTMPAGLGYYNAHKELFVKKIATRYSLDRSDKNRQTCHNKRHYVKYYWQNRDSESIK